MNLNWYLLIIIGIIFTIIFYNFKNKIITQMHKINNQINEFIKT